MLVNYHLKTLHSPLRFGIHLLVTYTLTFCIFSSIIVCIVRDPGPVAIEEPTRQDDDDGDINLTEALLADEHIDNLSAPGRFCRKCWTAKPERTHHCSVCGRCVLKMGMSVNIA
jgi:palmitoyltransferase ZDHHC2/15/20